MMLIDLISALKVMPADAVSRVALGNPHSYRGDYAQLAFEQEEKPQTAAEMLAVVEGAWCETFEGHKGGEFEMGDYSEVYLAKYGECGDRLTPVALQRMFDIKPKSMLFDLLRLLHDAHPPEGKMRHNITLDYGSGGVCLSVADKQNWLTFILPQEDLGRSAVEVFAELEGLLAARDAANKTPGGSL